MTLCVLVNASGRVLVLNDGSNLMRLRAAVANDATTARSDVKTCVIVDEDAAWAWRRAAGDGRRAAVVGADMIHMTGTDI